MCLRVCMLSRFSCVRLFVTPWSVACQVPLSMGFSRQEHWSGLPCSPLRDLPDPGTEPMSLLSPTLAEGFFTTESPGKPSVSMRVYNEGKSIRLCCPVLIRRTGEQVPSVCVSGKKMCLPQDFLEEFYKIPCSSQSGNKQTSGVCELASSTGSLAVECL